MEKTRAKARAAVHEVAVELVELYRKRLQVHGHAFAADTPWQRELEDSFGYTETPDQARAIEEVTADMEADRPMDRLVCGDVGFGKTEVAVRAAFKAVQDGKQVAVLVPTTLLAAQHAQTFADRYAGFPVRVEMLSRFLTAAEAREGGGRVGDGDGGRGGGDAPAAGRRHHLQGPGPVGGGRGATLRGQPQGDDQGHDRRASTCSP